MAYPEKDQCSLLLAPLPLVFTLPNKLCMFILSYKLRLEYAFLWLSLSGLNLMYQPLKFFFKIMHFSQTNFCLEQFIRNYLQSIKEI